MATVYNNTVLFRRQRNKEVLLSAALLSFKMESSALTWPAFEFDSKFDKLDEQRAVDYTFYITNESPNTGCIDHIFWIRLGVTLHMPTQAIQKYMPGWDEWRGANTVRDKTFACNNFRAVFPSCAQHSTYRWPSVWNRVDSVYRFHQLRAPSCLSLQLFLVFVQIRRYFVCSYRGQRTPLLGSWPQMCTIVLQEKR